MKTKIPPLFALAAAALLVGTPRSAIAGGEGIAAIGGFIGGMIVGSQVGSTHTHTHTTETVVVEHTSVPAEQSPAPAPEAAEDVRTLPLPVNPPAPPTTTTTTTTTVTRNGVPGYWEERPVQTWVPARWITTYDRYGFPVRRYEPGHYQTHMERVWVSGGVSTVGPATVVVEPAVVVAPPPYYYDSYYRSGPAIHVGIGYSHYRGGYYGSHYRNHYRPHYPVRPLPSRHYAPHYRSNHVPSHKANYVKGKLNSGSGGLRPKFH